MDRETLLTEHRELWRHLRSGLPGDLRRLRKPPATLYGIPFTGKNRALHALFTCQVFGIMGFTIRRMESLGVGVGKHRMRLARYRERFRRIVAENRDTVATLVAQGLAENIRGFEMCLAAIDPVAGAFPYGPAVGQDHGDWEFDEDILGSRDVAEDAMVVAADIGLEAEFDRSVEAFRIHDARLKSIIPFAVSQVAAFGGQIRPAGLFPVAYWWRQLAWAEGQKAGASAILWGKRGRLLRREAFSKGL